MALIRQHVTLAGPVVSSERTTWPEPGEVGFLGDEGSLTVVDSTATASAIAAGSYSNRLWTISGSGDLTLSGLLIRGGLRWERAGTLTIEDCVFEGEMGVQGDQSHSIKTPGPDPDNPYGEGAGLVIRDTTLRPKSGSRGPNHQSEGGPWIWTANATLLVERVDLSGTADGLQIAEQGSVIRDTCIHGLRYGGTYPENTHNDALMIFNDSGYLFQRVKFDASVIPTPWTNSSIFSQGGDGGTFDTCYFNGGGHCVYMETGAWAFRHCRWGRSFAYGNRYFEGAATATEWVDNAYLDNGQVITAPGT